MTLWWGKYKIGTWYDIRTFHILIIDNLASLLLIIKVLVVKKIIS